VARRREEHVSPLNQEGSRWWRLDHRVHGKRKTLSLGVFPDVSLKLARERREVARVDIALGIDPSAKRKAIKQAPDNSFEAVACERYEKFKSQWVDSHADKIICRPEPDVFRGLVHERSNRSKPIHGRKKCRCCRRRYREEKPALKPLPQTGNALRLAKMNFPSRDDHLA
jgi:hypothetical protein